LLIFCYTLVKALFSMLKTKNNRIGFLKKSGLLAAILVLSLFLFLQTNADNTNCSQLTGDDQTKCELLEKKADSYRDLIDIKNKQQDTLQKQMESIEAEQVQTKSQLQKTQSQAEQLVQQIVDIDRQIQEKEELIKKQQAILKGLMQSFYEDYQDGVLRIVLIDKDFSEIFNKPDYAQQTSTKVSDVLEAIKQTKIDLQKEYDDVTQKKQESERLKQQLQKQSSDLQATEIQKQTLMVQTQGEEVKYQKLLSRVEQEKLQLFDFSSAENIGDVQASVGGYAKPTSGLASTSWYFSQTDSRWGDKKIGNSSSLMKNYGCAVTSVAMVFKYYGASIDPGLMAKQKIFYYDLIKWPASWSPNITLSSSINHGNINWKTIDSELKKDHPVIVYIKKTNGGGGHYVVVNGKDSKDYIVHDPYFGANIYLGTSRALMGKLGKDSGTKVDQMIIYN
jgi:peptidoglycan hydrolase CwlO-like protein